MGDVDEGDAQFFLQALELDLHLLAELQVQGAQGLVQQEHLGAVDEGAGDGHPLLLTAGELIRLAPFIVGQLYQLQHLGDPLPDLILGNLFDGEAVGDVVEYGHVWEKRIVLEYGVHVPLVGLLVLDPFSLDFDDARGGVLESGDHPQCGGLTAAGGPQKREKFAFVDLHVHFPDH